jgi:tRNA threonylcarbamoyladenosine biosynthesis protein TsaE
MIDHNLHREQLLTDAAATHLFGCELADRLAPGRILLLVGDLGSGKTSLVQGLAAGLGITDAVASPTFTIVNEYLLGRIPLYHLDLYRLTPQEVVALQIERYWDPWEVEPGIVAIEWPERLQQQPESYWRIELAHRAESRTVKIWQYPEDLATNA